MNSQIDIGDILTSVHVPTLVIHITGDRTVNVEGGRFLAEHIPRARLLELPGDDHLFYIHEHTAARMADAIEEFLTGSVAAAGSDRVLATVLFTTLSARLPEPSNWATSAGTIFSTRIIRPSGANSRAPGETR